MTAPDIVRPGAQGKLTRYAAWYLLLVLVFLAAAFLVPNGTAFPLMEILFIAATCFIIWAAFKSK